MNDQNEPLLLDHEADGIRELDNKLPRWWVWLFYITIIFSAFYLLYYHVFNPDKTQATEYKAEMKKGEAVKVAAMGNFESSIATLQPSKDAAVLAQGLSVYTKFCAPC